MKENFLDEFNKNTVILAKARLWGWYVNVTTGLSELGGSGRYDKHPYDEYHRSWFWRPTYMSAFKFGQKHAEGSFDLILWKDPWPDTPKSVAKLPEE